MFTGNSRWSQETQDAVRNALITAFGKDIYIKLMKTERGIQDFIGDVRSTIVVKSVFVYGNQFLLISRDGSSFCILFTIV